MSVSYKAKCCLALMLSFIVGFGSCYYVMSHRADSKAIPPQQDSTNGLLSTTRIHAESKTNPNDADLVWSQKYTAVINGEKVSVPIVKRTTGTTYQPDSANSSNVPASPQDVKATVEQTIDLTPVLSRLHPSWELGTGVSYMNKKAYVPMSIQRNYAQDKALELTVLVDTDGKAQGAMIQHKWLIK